MRTENTILEWLLAGDPAIRWQVQRDLLDEKPAVYERERAKVAHKGWGARYLAAQDKAGTWAQALYSPKWTSTHYTLWTLRFLGLAPKNPQALKACEILMDKGFLDDGGIYYTASPKTNERRRDFAETCITGMALSLFSYFRLDDKRVELIAKHLIEQQMGDSGWNCRSYKGDKHSSFNTTLLVLEGLREFQGFRPKSKLPVAAALKEGREFLLQHRLYRSHRTGNIVKHQFTVAPAQPSWQYDFLRALDHFQAAKAPRDLRLQGAIEFGGHQQRRFGPRHRIELGRRRWLRGGSFVAVDNLRQWRCRRRDSRIDGADGARTRGHALLCREARVPEGGAE